MTKKLENQLLGRRVKLLSHDWQQTLVGTLVWVESRYFVIRQDHDVLLAVSRKAIGAFSQVADPPRGSSQP